MLLEPRESWWMGDHLAGAVARRGDTCRKELSLPSLWSPTKASHWLNPARSQRQGSPGDSICWHEPPNHTAERSARVPDGQERISGKPVMRG